VLLVGSAGLTSLILKGGLYKKVLLPLFAIAFSFFLSQGKQASCFRIKFLDRINFVDPEREGCYTAEKPCPSGKVFLFSLRPANKFAPS